MYPQLQHCKEKSYTRTVSERALSSGSPAEQMVPNTWSNDVNVIPVAWAVEWKALQWHGLLFHTLNYPWLGMTLYPWIGSWQLGFGILKVDNSSQDINRGFCKTCGANVLLAEVGSETVKIAVGLISAPEGTRAQAWLNWSE